MYADLLPAARNAQNVLNFIIMGTEQNGRHFVYSFQMHSRDRKYLYFDSMFAEVCP